MINMRNIVVFNLFCAICALGLSSAIRTDDEKPVYLGGVTPQTKGMPWPLPQVMSTKEEMVFLHPKFFNFEITGETCAILDEALLRYKPPTLYATGATRTTGKQKQTRKTRHVELNDELPPLPILKTLVVALANPCEEWPYHGMDEAYTLDVGVANIETATLTSNSIWGILRGLETFSHLFWKGEHGELIGFQTTIEDFPRFPHRGILFDTSRHYLPIEVIKENIDLMAMNKFNTLHWHIVDDPSFPYESILFPQLSELGSYTKDMVYSLDDVMEVIEYARVRGIRVMSEYDTPGHTQSWGPGQPGLLTQCYDEDGNPREGVFGPVDPTKEENYDFMKTFFYEVTSIFPEKFVHLGGDEVSMGCWESNPDVVAFMKANNISSGKDLQEYYIERLMDIVKELDSEHTILLWQEMFDDSAELNKDVVVHVWKGPDSYASEVKKITDRGMKVILSSCWYLNVIYYGSDWHTQYECDPGNGIEEDKRSLLMGGEAAIWGEWVDETNVIQRLWPRASAVAERLWSNEQVNDVGEATPRLEEHRCRLLGRGHSAEPINGPSFCA